MTRGTRLVFWLAFCAVQLAGWNLLSFADYVGAGDSQSPFVMFTELAGVLLLFPGFLLAAELGPDLIVRLLVTVACNAIFWFACSAACSAAWRKLRGKHQA